ncbi:MAG: hypothetical protein V1793_09750 [Pseudomonadota bacterium]
MQLDNDSFYRNKITPWYDTPSVSWMTIWISILIMIFAAAGLGVVLNTPEFKGFLWVPLTLGCFCLYLIVRAAIRITNRDRTS